MGKVTDRNIERYLEKLLVTIAGVHGIRTGKIKGIIERSFGGFSLLIGIYSTDISDEKKKGIISRVQKDENILSEIYSEFHMSLDNNEYVSYDIYLNDFEFSEYKLKRVRFSNENLIEHYLILTEFNQRYEKSLISSPVSELSVDVKFPEDTSKALVNYTMVKSKEKRDDILAFITMNIMANEVHFLYKKNNDKSFMAIENFTFIIENDLKKLQLKRKYM